MMVSSAPRITLCDESVVLHLPMHRAGSLCALDCVVAVQRCCLQHWQTNRWLQFVVELSAIARAIHLHGPR